MEERSAFMTGLRYSPLHVTEFCERETKETAEEGFSSESTCPVHLVISSIFGLFYPLDKEASLQERGIDPDHFLKRIFGYHVTSEKKKTKIKKSF